MTGGRPARRIEMAEEEAGVGGALETVAAQLSRVEGLARRRATRRDFLQGGLVTAGALGAGILLAGCGPSASASPRGSMAPEGGDLRIARLAGSLEVLAINAYEVALQAAVSGSLGRVPAAVTTYLTAAKSQHAEHRDSWNALLTKNSRAAQIEPDAKLRGTVEDALSKMRSVADAAQLVLSLESIALQTYIAGAAVTTDGGERLMALTIAPVEAQHAASLALMLGKYPVPDVQVKNDMARSPDDLRS